MVVYYLFFRINKLLQPEHNVPKGKCGYLAKNNKKPQQTKNKQLL